VLLHLCQPTELGSKKLGRVKPNGGVTYLGVDNFFLSQKKTQEEP